MVSIEQQKEISWVVDQQSQNLHLSKHLQQQLENLYQHFLNTQQDVGFIQDDYEQYQIIFQQEQQPALLIKGDDIIYVNRQKVEQKIQKQFFQQDQSKDNNQQQNIEFQIKTETEQDQTIVIKFADRVYSFKQKDQDQDLQETIQFIKKNQEQIINKCTQNIQQILHPHYQFTMIEGYIFQKFEKIFYKERKQNFQNNTCCICQDEIYENLEKFDQQKYFQQLQKQDENDCVYLNRCSDHYMHANCLINLQNSKKEQYIKCPVCSKIYGILIGDRPDGTMHHIDKSLKCHGFNCGTIVITYSFPSGVRNKIPYSGTQRIAYFPDNQEGNEILQMLQIAFERKHIFTVGTSLTTGAQNQVVWYGIHHKTSPGRSSHGYPDPTYFIRIKQELSDKGITLDDIKRKKN